MKKTLSILLVSLAIAIGFSIYGVTHTPMESIRVIETFVNPETVIVIPEVDKARQEFRGADAIFVGEIKEDATTILVKCSIPDRGCIVTITVYKEEPQWVGREGEQLYQGTPKDSWMVFSVEGYHWLTIHRTLAECKCAVLEGSFECKE